MQFYYSICNSLYFVATGYCNSGTPLDVNVILFICLCRGVSEQATDEMNVEDNWSMILDICDRAKQSPSASVLIFMSYHTILAAFNDKDEFTVVLSAW